MSVNHRSPISKSAEPKPRKLRASCDACSRAKVKCDKARPSCHRCGNMGICCNYSPSMRLGKPRKNRSMDIPFIRSVSPATSCGAFSSRPDIRPRTASSTAESSPEPINPFFFGPNTPEYPYQDAFVAGFNSRYSPESTTGPTSLPGYHTEDLFLTPSEPLFSSNMSQFPSFYDAGALSAPITMPSHSAHFQSQQNIHHSMYQADNKYYAFESYFTNPKPTFFEPPTMIPLPLPTPSASASASASVPTSSPGPHARNHDCTDFAFATLSALYSPPSYQPSTTDFGNSLPTLDTILATTKDAIDKVTVLLGCPCSTNPHYSTTVAFTIIKILDWYRAIAGLNSSTTDAKEPLAAFSSTAAPVRWMIEGREDHRFRTQLCLAELRKVERLVNRFSERYCKDAREKVDTGAGGVYGGLEMLLRTRVRETVRLVMEEV